MEQNLRLVLHTAYLLGRWWRHKLLDEMKEFYDIRRQLLAPFDYSKVPIM